MPNTPLNISNLARVWFRTKSYIWSMAWVDRFNRKYHLETLNTRELILDTFKSRITNPVINPNLYAYEQVDYKRITLDFDTLTSKREDMFDAPGKGKGTITVMLKDSDYSSTMINAEIKPMIMGLTFGIYVGMMTLASLIVLLFKPIITVIPLLLGWLMLYGMLYRRMFINRNRLKSYLILILSDLGIKEKLSESN
ncbi:MAG: hypothetical protein JWQ63_714 [Mucilaginibacter sp.]|nr:hypothetical protein [Mucilaginibacter sp.]